MMFLYIEKHSLETKNTISSDIMFFIGIISFEFVLTESKGFELDTGQYPYT